MRELDVLSKKHEDLHFFLIGGATPLSWREEERAGQVSVLKKA